VTADRTAPADVGDPPAPAERPSPLFVRLAAALVDFTVVLIAVLPIQLIWTHPDGDRSVPTSGANWLALAVVVGYPVISNGRSGRTLGKRMFGMRVARVDGRPVGWIRAIVRFAVSFAPFLTGPLLRLAPEGAARSALEVVQVALMASVYAPILFDEQRRGIHDRIAGTRVLCSIPPLLRPPTDLTIGG